MRRFFLFVDTSFYFGISSYVFTHEVLQLINCLILFGFRVLVFIPFDFSFLLLILVSDPNLLVLFVAETAFTASRIYILFINDEVRKVCNDLLLGFHRFRSLELNVAQDKFSSNFVVV